MRVAAPDVKQACPMLTQSAESLINLCQVNPAGPREPIRLVDANPSPRPFLAHVRHSGFGQPGIVRNILMTFWHPAIRTPAPREQPAHARRKAVNFCQ